MRTMNDYQARAHYTAVYPDCGKGTLKAATYCALKLAGEAGEVAEKLAKYEYRGDPLPEGCLLYTSPSPRD